MITFSVAYACSLTFVYVEGDDASSILYHALGRDQTIQLPYGPYHGGLDLVLSLLPPNEAILRVGAMSLTSAATVCAVLLLLTLVFEWLGVAGCPGRALVAAVLPLAVPELLYLGLVYCPPTVGMCLLLCSHLLLRRSGLNQSSGELARNRWRVILWVGSSVLFGIGLSCRWDLAIYGWVVLADSLMLLPPKGGWSVHRLSHRLIALMAWGVGAATTWLAVILSSGFGPGSLLEVVRYASGRAAKPVGSPFVWAGSYLSVLTPAFALLAAWGAWVLWRRDRRIFAFVVIATAPVVPFLRWNVPKGVLAFFPVWVAAMAAGATDIWFRDRSRLRACRAAIAALLLLPWLIGVRATYDDRAWGPGFELRPYDRPLTPTNRVSVTLGAGAAIMTQEGARPVFGHLSVLFGGGWRRLVASMAEERTEVIRTAAQLDLPIYCVQGGMPTIEADLLRLGYSTRDKSVRLVPGKPFLYVRRFQSITGKCVRVFGSGTMAPGLLTDPAVARKATEELGVARVVGYSSDSSAARRLYRAAPEAMQRIGNRSALVDLDVLARVISPSRVKVNSE